MSEKKPRWIFVLPVFCSILLAAHFSRVQNDILAVFFFIFPLLLLIRKRWILRIYQLYLAAGSVIWFERAMFLRQQRVEDGQPWERMTIILVFVAVLSIIAILILQRQSLRRFYSAGKYSGASLAAFLITGGGAVFGSP